MDMPQKELDAIAAERAKIFTPKWFADLFGARLGYGDTFWLGNFGVLIFVVPMTTLAVGLLYARAPDGVIPFIRILAAAMGIWLLGVTQALVRIGPKGGWPIFGILWTVGAAITALLGALQL